MYIQHENKLKISKNCIKFSMRWGNDYRLSLEKHRELGMDKPTFSNTTQMVFNVQRAHHSSNTATNYGTRQSIPFYDKIILHIPICSTKQIFNWPCLLLPINLHCILEYLLLLLKQG
jgi:hypothetical protein